MSAAAAMGLESMRDKLTPLASNLNRTKPSNEH